MGRELAAAIGRWSALDEHPVRPGSIAVCDTSPAALRWFDRVDTVTRDAPTVAKICSRTTRSTSSTSPSPTTCTRSSTSTPSRAGKDFLGEKPFGIDLAAAERIVAAIERGRRLRALLQRDAVLPRRAVRPRRRCAAGATGAAHRGRARLPALQRPRPLQADQLEAPGAASAARSGVMGDLGMHVAHVPLRLGWRPTLVLRPAAATSSPSARTREPASRSPATRSTTRRCSCDAGFPLTLRTHRIAPGHMNTWRITATGMDGGVSFSTAAAQDRASLRRPRRPPGLGAPGGRQPVGLRRRSPAPSSSSGSPTRSCRCGPPILAERAGRAGRRASAVPPRARRSTRTASSTPPCARDRPGAPSLFSLPRGHRRGERRTAGAGAGLRDPGTRRPAARRRGRGAAALPRPPRDLPRGRRQRHVLRRAHAATPARSASTPTGARSRSRTSAPATSSASSRCSTTSALGHGRDARRGRRDRGPRRRHAPPAARAPRHRGQARHRARPAPARGQRAPRAPVLPDRPEPRRGRARRPRRARPQSEGAGAGDVLSPSRRPTSPSSPAPRASRRAASSRCSSAPA